MATGQFLFKLDGHCCLTKGYDEGLKACCGESDVIVPAKRSLDVETWSMHREPWHYWYLMWPWQTREDGSIKFVGLQDRNYDPSVNVVRAHQRVDDILTYQGSAWMLRRSWWDRILPNGMDHEHYYYAAEPLEVGLTSWVSGGRVRIVKDVEYGHLWKGKGEHKRQFLREKRKWLSAMEWSAQYWMAHPGFAPLIDRFGPLPGWPQEWQTEAAQRWTHDDARSREGVLQPAG